MPADAAVMLLPRALILRCRDVAAIIYMLCRCDMLPLTPLISGATRHMSLMPMIYVCLRFTPRRCCYRRALARVSDTRVAHSARRL